MIRETKLLAAATLFCGTALTPALAQEANQTAGSGQPCERLSQLIEENEDRFRDEWIEEARGVVRQDQSRDCEQYAAQAEEAVRELDRRAAQNQQTGAGEQQAGAGEQRQGDRTDPNRIVVEQPEPRVTVEQSSPQITYDQPQPRVNVQQGQPEVIVRQAEPTIRVEMPRPRITISQPEPEIVVRMPRPDVAVSTPEPQIDVSQASPDVQVRQPEPEVTVQGEDTAQVEIERGQPVIQEQDAGTQQQARVNVERQRPQVRYESAEPNVEFEMTGEPQVSYERSGEPRVRFEQMEQQQAAAEDAPQGAGDDRQRQQTAAQDTQQDTGADQQQRQASAEQARDVDEQQTTAGIERRQVSEQTYDMLRGDGGQEAAGEPTTILVTDLIDRDLVNLRGEDLGTVERVIRANDRVYVVLSHGGFLGLGEDEVALPLDRISSVRGDDELVLRGMTEEDIEQLPEVDADAGQELGANQEVRISQS